MQFHKKIKRFAGILAVFLAGSCTVLLAQTIPVLESLSVEDGLSQGFVRTIFQDSEGFIWIGTRNGLNRYDGRTVRTIRHDPLNPYSISGNTIADISESGDYLLIRTSNGLDFYHKKTNRFFRLKVELPANLEPFWKSIKAALTDDAGFIWLLASNNRDKQWILKTVLKHTPPNKPEAWKLNVLQYWEVKGGPESKLLQTKGYIWAMSKSRLHGISKKTGSRRNLTVPGGLSGTFQAAPDTIWFGGTTGWGCLADSTLHWTNTGFFTQSVWPSENGDQLFVLTSKTLNRLKWAGFDHKPQAAAKMETVASLENGVFVEMFRDRSGVVWLGTNGYGLRKFMPRLNRFKTYNSAQTVKGPLFIDSAGNFGYVSNAARMPTINKFSPQFQFADFPFMGAINGFTRTHVDLSGRHWVVAILDKNKLVLFCTAEADNSWKRVLHIPVEFPTFFASAIDKRNVMWVATVTQLIRIDLKTLEYAVFDYSISTRIWPYGLVQDPDGNWWIASKQGLLRGVPTGDNFQFKLYQATAGRHQTIQYDIVTSLLTDPRHPRLLWIGTLGGGLSRLDTRTLTFTHYNTRTGLSDDVIYGILADAENNLWLSTNYGLMRFNPETGSVRNFTVEDGLPINEFNLRAYAKRKDGTMFFGSLRGLVTFHPSEFVDNPVPPPVRITGLNVNGEPVKYGDSTGILNQEIEYTPAIKLLFSQNSITLQLSALEYSIPAKNRFQYYLQGAEREWAHTTTDPQANYLNLPPGKYTFIVKACNSDGVWSDTPTSLKITVLPPWYRTWWAYLLYASSLGGAVFFFYRYQLRQQLALVENRRLKEINHFKSRIYANITHEFRTPLTVILGMAGEIKQFTVDTPLAKLRQAGALIERNGTNLLQLVNQLLDMARVEAHALTLQPVQADLVPFAKYLLGGFESLVASRDIQLLFESNVAAIPMAIDKDQVQTILYNLLSNAIKFSEDNGTIVLSLKLESDWQTALNAKHYRAVTPPPDAKWDSWVAIAVRDTGSGIPADQLPSVFDRFYQAPTNEAGGSGIGLALVKELVLLMKGALAVRSQPGKWTEFVVVLPVWQIKAMTNTLAHSQIADSDASAESQNIRSIEHQNEERPSVLIIEDNADVLQYIRTCLEGNYNIQTAQNGQEGIESALETVPDLIISDVMMPLKDGFEVVNTLKNDERTSHIPMVLLTAKADRDSRLKGLKRGADVYLSKPFDRTELLIHLRNLLELRQKLQARYVRDAVARDTKLKAQRDLKLEDAFMQKAQAALDAHMQEENFGVPELCNALGMSRTQLHRKITALTGKSAGYFIRSARLQKARHLLLTTEMTVTEVSYEVGYRNLAHFSTSFAEVFGQSPSSLKK
ncbi:MAG: response regulator [Lewinellaceae bacterium]|nr:response regulator [Lewinellaceae bacterium]